MLILRFFLVDDTQNAFATHDDIIGGDFFNTSTYFHSVKNPFHLGVVICTLNHATTLLPTTTNKSVVKITTIKGKGYFNTMKVRASVKKISPDDIIVRRKGVLRVINKKKPKNKQRQG